MITIRILIVNPLRAYVAIDEGDPLGLEDVEAAAEEFRRRIIRLAEREPDNL